MRHAEGIEIALEELQDTPALQPYIEKALDNLRPCGRCHPGIPAGRINPADPAERCERCTEIAGCIALELLQDDGLLVHTVAGGFALVGFTCGSCTRVHVGVNPTWIEVMEDYAPDTGAQWVPQPFCARCVKHEQDNIEA